MAKMFYTNEEAAARLGATPDQIKQYVTDSKLREFRDGSRVMFKVDQVDRLAKDLGTGPSDSGLGLAAAGSGSDSGIDLAPTTGIGSSSGLDAISLADAPTISAGAKDDTVVVAATQGAGPTKTVVDTGTPKSSGDSAAQTQIQSAIDDQFSLEGVGSGSGLLDLTRERDDTSLGAELLDEIYPGGGEAAKTEPAGIGSSSGVFDQAPAGEMPSSSSGLDHIAATPAAPAAGPMEIVEAYDSTSGMFGGMALAATLVLGLTMLIVLLDYQDLHPEWVKTLTANSTNMIIFGGVMVLVTMLLSLVGLFVGKASAAK